MEYVKYQEGAFEQQRKQVVMHNYNAWIIINNAMTFHLHFPNPAMVRLWSGSKMKLWFKVHHQVLLGPSTFHWSVWVLVMQASILAEHD